MDQNQPHRVRWCPAPCASASSGGSWADVGLCLTQSGLAGSVHWGRWVGRALSTGGWGGRGLSTGGWAGGALSTGAGVDGICPLGRGLASRSVRWGHLGVASVHYAGQSVRLCPLGRAGCRGDRGLPTRCRRAELRGFAFRSISGVLSSPRTWRGPGCAGRVLPSSPGHQVPTRWWRWSVLSESRPLVVGGAGRAQSTVEETGSPESRRPGRSSGSCLEPGLGGGPRGVRWLACQLAGSACSMTQGKHLVLSRNPL